MTSTNQPVVRLYYVPQFFPCGPQSSCCGPSGQSKEQIDEYVLQLQQHIPDVQVETVDATQPLQDPADAAPAKLLASFGPAACPIFAVAGEVVAAGPPQFPDLAELIKAKLAPAQQ